MCPFPRYFIVDGCQLAASKNDFPINVLDGCISKGSIMMHNAPSLCVNMTGLESLGKRTKYRRFMESRRAADICPSSPASNSKLT